jgi:hypothetical protein
MAVLIARPVTAFITDEDRNRQSAKSIAYHALKIFVQDCKDFISKTVTTEINRQKRDSSDKIVTFAKTREVALKKWMKAPDPLAWETKNSGNDGRNCGNLILALAPTPEAIELGLPEADESLTYKAIAEHLIATVKKSTAKAPFSKNGFFMSTLPLALIEINRLRRVDITAHPSDSYLAAVFAVVMMHMKIDFVPWHHPSTPGQSGPAPTVVTHQRWMYINRSSSNRQPSNVVKDPSPQERAQAVADTMSQLHPSATWSIPNLLREMGPLWKKAVLPTDWDIANASLDSLEDKKPASDYILDIYKWVEDNIDPTNWKHHMAIVWSILFTAILPNVRTPTEEKARVAKFKDPASITKAIRSLAWIPYAGTTHRGVSSRPPYVTMLSTLLISIMEPRSPMRIRFSEGKGLGELWSDKHSG